MSERVTLSMDELKRVYVLEQVEEKKLSGREAAQRLGLSIRQVRRLLVKYREAGAPGLAHGNRGRAPHNRVSEEVRRKIQELSAEEYRDYNDSHFTEELTEEHGVVLSRCTVRRIRREAGQRSPRKRRAPRHRSWRERKERAGMLLQTDGSRHDWLEGRGPYLTLIGYIDDATGELMGAVFREQEDAAGYFLGLRSICQQQGIPAAIYADRHSIFQSSAKASIEQELDGEEPKSQFGRLAHELGIELIAARSPQAKGRVERLWGTLQDRLVKDLRKAGASNEEQANRVLIHFLPKFNQHFRVEPAQPETAFLPWPKQRQVDDFFCFKHVRTVSNDNTLPFDGQRLQIPPGTPITSYAHKKVEVRHHLDGRLEVRYQDRRLAIFEPVDSDPVRMRKFSPAPGQTATTTTAQDQPKKLPQKPLGSKPAVDHPWRKYKDKRMEKMTDPQMDAK